MPVAFGIRLKARFSFSTALANTLLADQGEKPSFGGIACSCLHVCRCHFPENTDSCRIYHRLQTVPSCLKNQYAFLNTQATRTSAREEPLQSSVWLVKHHSKHRMLATPLMKGIPSMSLLSPFPEQAPRRWP
jgi:hypothetical protein